MSLLTRRLLEGVRDAAEVRCQLPVRLGNRSEPEPDFAVVKPRGRHYAKAHPVAEDVLLVVEISNSTLGYDRYVKIPLYARHRIPEAWLIDVQSARIRFFRDPRDTGYADMSASERPGIARLAALPDAKIDLAEIFGGLTAG